MFPLRNRPSGTRNALTGIAEVTETRRVITWRVSPLIRRLPSAVSVKVRSTASPFPSRGAPLIALITQPTVVMFVGAALRRRTLMFPLQLSVTRNTALRDPLTVLLISAGLSLLMQRVFVRTVLCTKGLDPDSSKLRRGKVMTLYLKFVRCCVSIVRKPRRPPRLEIGLTP